MDQRNLLVQIANQLLLTSPLEEETLNLSDQDLAIEIQKLFQQEIKNYYKESEFSKNIKNLNSTEEVLDSLINYATGESKGPTSYLPKLHRQNSSCQMECTLTSAFLKLALEEKGKQNMRTCLLRGHQVTIQANDDGSIQLYDAANTHTINGVRHGFSHLFSKDEVIEKSDVEDRTEEPNAFTYTIQSELSPQELHSGILELNGNLYSKKFYAHDPDILISISVVLDNLNGEKSKAEFSFLKDMNYDAMKERFNLLDKGKYL